MIIKSTTRLQILLPEATRRRIKSLAAREGLTIGQAVERAFQAWESELQAGRSAPGSAQPSSQTAALQKPNQAGRTAESGPAPRQTQASAQQPSANPSTSSGQAPSISSGQAPGHPRVATSGGAPVAGQPARSADWLRGAGQLDWAKCQEAECLQGKNRSVWVVRGTTTPLAHIFEAVAEGHPFGEIAEVYEVTLQQLMAMLQFAAQSSAPPASGR